MTHALRLACLSALALAPLFNVAGAQDRPTTRRTSNPTFVRGDTLIRVVGGPEAIEMAFLVTPDSVVAFRVGEQRIHQVLEPREALVVRAQWKSIATGTPLDTALLPALLRFARERASTARPDFRLTRQLKNGMRVDFHGDTIRFVPAKGSAGEERVFTLTPAGAALIVNGTARPVSEQWAGLLAFLRSNEFDSLDIEAKIAELMRGR